MALIQHIVQAFAEQIRGGTGIGISLLGRDVYLRYCKEMKPHFTKTGNISPGKYTTYINTINELE